MPAETLTKPLGAHCGDLGRVGFGWPKCKVPEVLARVKFLHPILYQHGPSELLNNVKAKFGEGVTFEYKARP